MPPVHRSAAQLSTVSAESPQLQSQRLGFSQPDDLTAELESLLSRYLGRASPDAERLPNAPAAALLAGWLAWQWLDSPPAEQRQQLKAAAQIIDPLNRALHLRTVGRHARRPVDPGPIEAAYSRGLDSRLGSLLIPPAGVSPWPLFEIALFGWVRGLIVAARSDQAQPNVAFGLDSFELALDDRWSVEISGAPSICRGCSAIFRPAGRKTAASYCPLCSKRPAAPAVAYAGPAVGSQVRIPAVTNGGSVVGWRSSWAERCAVCGAEIVKARRTGVALCKSGGCRDRYYRQQTKNPAN